MKKALLFLILVLSLTEEIFSQGCTVTASAPRDTIVCGDNVLLSAFGRGQGIALLSENFNTGSYGPGWAATQQAMWNNPCSPSGVDGTTHIWMGNSSPVPRVLTTTSFNLSSCVNAGVTICFDMLFAEQGNSAPCEGPDEPLEGVYLQYSIDNGVTWTTINYFDPNGGNDPTLVNWNNWCFPVPAVALTSNTKFRWYQDADSGADYDHWGIDNVVIYCNDPTYNVVWQHDGYNSGPTGGVNPTPVAPRTTTSYVVVMSNGTVTCRDTVTVVVRNPTLIVDAGNDTTVCTGQCARLNATAKILVSPAKVITYSNNEITPITTGLGQVSNIGINVTGLNMGTVLPNSITQICINNVFFFGFNIFPPGQVDISDLILTLVCPDGTSIVLVPANVTTGGSDPLTGGYNNTCFVPAGPNIATGTAPYTGSWAPNQPFNNLTGCNANGVWLLNVTMNSSLGFGTGTFSGWSITFDDPEISYTGNFNWSPTTNMTGSNTLTPTVCPPPNTFTITVSDTAGCVTQSDAVNVNVQSCCGLSATVTSVQPTCAAANGSINVTPSPAGSYSFAWSDGPSVLQNRTGLPAGSYTVTITDNADPTCTFDTTLTLNSNSTLTASFTNPVNPTCAGNDGSITINLAGGTAPYTVVADTNGAPVFSGTLPFPLSTPVPGLPAGTVNVTVTDAQGCIATATATLTAPTNCCTFTVSAALTQPGCAQTNGGITLTPANGSGNYSYAWGGGLGTSNSISNVGAGPYTVTITDNGFANCFIDTSFTLNSNSTLSASFTNPVNPTCAGNDGSITINLAGGTAPYTVVADTNGSTVFSGTLPFPLSTPVPGLPAGTVNVTVTDAQGCIATATATLTAPTNCCTFTVSAVLTQPACAQTNGGIALTTANGSGNYSYVWSGGLGTNDTVTNLGAGNYLVTITDNAYANCSIDTLFVLTNPNSPVIDSFKILNVTCTGGGSDGSVSVYASSINGVNVSTGYTWSNTTLDTDDTQSGLAAGTYLFTVTDLAGCSTPGSVTIGTDAACCFLQIAAAVTPPTCGSNNASVTVNITTAGTAPYTYSIDGTNYQAQNIFNNVVAGNYNVITLDANLCSDTVAVTVPVSGNNLLVTIAVTDITCFGATDGAATVSVIGGATPYSYIWNNLLTSASLTNLSAGTYSVTVTDPSGCSGSATSNVIEPSALGVTLDVQNATCFGAPNGSIDAVVSGGTPAYSFQWTGGLTGQNITGLTAGSYAVTVSDNTGCSASASTTITEPAILTFIAIGIQVKCPGDENGRIIISANGGGTQPYTFVATQDGSNFESATNDTIIDLASGNYDVILSDSNGCTLVEDVIVPAPVPDNFTWTADSTSCYGTGTDGSVRVDGTTPENFPYQFGINGGTIGFVNDFYNLAAGSHTISALNGWGCPSQINVYVPEPIESVATIFPGDTTIELGESISLSSTLTPSNTGAVSYLWTPATGLSCTDCPNPTVYTYSRSTQYVLTVTYNDFCKAIAEVLVGVSSKPEVFIPNSFSPNGDGNNDKWMVYGKAMKAVDLKIFNRWGEKIYETNNVLDGWDGTYKGVLQNPAVFVYEAVITFLDDKTDTRMGSIMLLR